ncbi:extracellular solute-binding protein [Vibrio astriarenae]|uniref:Extracellular solute-binding protein n=1 Tax=Vibrio astriarenae TaxID=1481923 RepID=A0A7Z2T327_9VIBR|nr:extracellular solute-binding protein [Vibrio astriarenae]QIA63463.1 extracellular solute-binding protein [Vibrio astriarenae]
MFKLKPLLVATAVCCVSLSSLANAETTVRMMHIETDPNVLGIWQDVAKDFEAQNPDIKINIEFLENEAFKAKLPTLLQSNQRPDLFYSWGGGNFQVRADAGLLEDMTGYSATLNDELSQAGMNAFRIDDKQYGAPYMVSQVGFWYNKKLFKQAGVDGDSIKTWDQFLTAVEQLKAAGITPIAVGGADKWPMHFYWSYLVMRSVGQEEFNNAMLDKGEGFESEAFVRAGAELKRLADLEPFQPGFMAAGYGESAGLFGDQKAAIHLMGDWDYNFQAQQAVDKIGVVDADLGFMNFPTLKDGQGDASDTLGGINGFAFAKGAKPEAAKWLEFFLNKQSQTKLAEIDQIIPVAKGADQGLKNPFKQQISQTIAEAQWHQVFFDQALGADVGGVVNDISVGIVNGDITPREAAEQVQEAWEMR